MPLMNKIREGRIRNSIMFLSLMKKARDAKSSPSLVMIRFSASENTIFIYCFSHFFQYVFFFQRRCKLFVYGGCKGNQNNFISEIDCVRRCGDESMIDDLPELTQITTQKIGYYIDSR